jgi:acyl carrier protein
MNILEAITVIFREVFDDDDINIAPEMTANDIDGWDSLSHVNLIMAIEARFNLKFTRKELSSFKNVGDIMDCVKSKTTSQ